MLACLQRQNQPVQRLMCNTKILDSPVHHQSDLSSVCSLRFPSAAELDAYAQKTANTPLSIKIFPTNIRVPQHKQINRTVNGLDISRCSGSFSMGYQGLLAIVNTPRVAKGVLKSSEGKRKRLSPIQLAAAPYMPPRNRPRQKLYVGLCKAPEVMTTSAASEPPAYNVTQHVSRPSNSSPALLMATAASCSDSVAGVAYSSLPYTGAVLPTQSAGAAAEYREDFDYWQHKQRGVRHRYTHASLCTYSTGGSPDLCVPVGSTQHPYRSHNLRAKASVTAGTPERVNSPLQNYTAMCGNFPAGQFFAPLWHSVLTTPDSYNQQELPTGSCKGLGHPHSRRPSRSYLSQGKSRCQASLLSSSLQSLESLIREIQPPCIKEQMLGRGSDAMGIAPPLDYQNTHIQPVLRRDTEQLIALHETVVRRLD